MHLIKMHFWTYLTIFDEAGGVWISDGTPPLESEKSSQLNLKLGVGGEEKSMLVKTGYPNLLYGCDHVFFVSA